MEKTDKNNEVRAIIEKYTKNYTSMRGKVHLGGPSGMIRELFRTKRQERSISDREQDWQRHRVMKEQGIFREWDLVCRIGKV